MNLTSTASAGAASRPLVTLCLLGGVAAGVGLAPLATHAQQPPLPSSTTAPPGDTALDAVVVSASREGGRRRQTPAAIDVISERVIEAKRPAFIGEVLNQAAGVYMPDLRNEQHMMSIRHPLTTGAAYLYMEDGLPLRPPGLFNHNALYELNLEGIDRIEVLRGPASSLYGSNAVGGAVNFFTRSGSNPADARRCPWGPCWCRSPGAQSPGH